MAETEISSTKAQQFFALDIAAWERVTELGLNPAVAFLVLASGTGRSQRLTKWGVHAIEKFAGMGRKRAGDALAALRDADMLRRAAGKEALWELGFPRDTAAAPDLSNVAWLPNEVVIGLPLSSGELDENGRPKRGESILARLRQTQNLPALRLLIAMYESHHLPDEGGIDRRALSEKYKAHRLYERGEFVVWAFTYDSRQGHADFAPTSKIVPDHKRPAAWDEFFAAVRLLTDIGAVEFVNALVEAGESGEIIHTMSAAAGEPEEQRVGVAAHRAGHALLDVKAQQARPKGAWLVPVHRHLGDVQLVGIARLTHRPKTKMTAAWYAKIARLTEIAEKYEQIAAAAQGNAKSSAA